VLHTDNLSLFEFDMFDAGGPQCHFITTVQRAGKFSYIHWPLCKMFY